MSEEAKSESSKWQILHERGIVLKDAEIDFVVDNLEQGINDVYDYLQISTEDRNLGFISSDNLSRIGYAAEQGAINIPMAFLNKLAQSKKPLHELTTAVSSVVKHEVPFAIYLRNAGREETIHHFQIKGHPLLHAHFPNNNKYMESTELNRLLCDYEVEARKITDKIAIHLGEKPIWAELDKKLSQDYKENYDKPLE